MHPQPSHDRAQSVQRAREAFDLDEAMRQLPPADISPLGPRGAAGYRLRASFRADIEDGLLREFAKAELGIQRLSAGCLDALRVILGNQAHAEQRGFTLEMNIRVDFASARTMRTILDKMREAGLTEGVTVQLGKGRVQTVQTFKAPSGLDLLDLVSLNTYLRYFELLEDTKLLENSGLHHHVWPDVLGPVLEAEVPY